MRVEILTTQNFRNLVATRLTPAAPIVVLKGHNAQGKTNILEALYLCATGRSFRHATARQMLQHTQAAGQVRAQLERHEVRHQVSMHLHPTGRTIKVDDRGIKQATDLLALMNMVAFFPDDLRIAKGSPEDRRRFIDRAVANSQPPFVKATLAYHQALRSRNALLRAPSAPDRGLLGVYDDQLVQYGSTMQALRLGFLATLRPIAAHYFAQMMPRVPEMGLHITHGIGNLDATLSKTPTVAPNHAATDASGSAYETLAAHYAEAFADALTQGFARDRKRGMTLVGPHRSDLLLSIAQQDARIYASQGQQRALILALKLAEVQALHSRLGTPPILLLDDVSSELDAERNRLLFDVVTGMQCQVWVTTTGTVNLPLPAASQTFYVEHGHVQEVA